jgi:hypothetical protein
MLSWYGEPPHTFFSASVRVVRERVRWNEVAVALKRPAPGREGRDQIDDRKKPPILDGRRRAFERVAIDAQAT